MPFSLQLDGWIIVAGILCAVASALLGSFLVLRRMSLLGDAISHAVLPGLAAAFLFSGSRSSGLMFVGAVVVGVLTALLTDFIHRRGSVDEGAAMGVVFTTLFALGLVTIVIAADRVDLDPDCVLYGSIERTPLDQWTMRLPPETRQSINATGPATLSLTMPRVVWMLSAVTLLNVAFTLVFFKELKLTTFDPSLAGASGFSPAWMHYALMTLVAITAVACFESVGNILVVAMFVVPPASAFLLTERLGWLISLACLIGALSAVLGHFAAIIIPIWFGFGSTTTAGMMAVMTGVFFLAALFLAPQKGLVPRLVRRWWLAWSILTDDVLSLLYRIEERPDLPRPPRIITKEHPQTQWIAESLLTTTRSIKLAFRWHAWRGRVTLKNEDEFPRLTELGRANAVALVRSHRLWEHYLVTQSETAETKIHDTAHQLEHFTNSDLRERLDKQSDSPGRDPHGSEIPSVDDERN